MNNTFLLALIKKVLGGGFSCTKKFHQNSENNSARKMYEGAHK